MELEPSSALSITGSADLRRRARNSLADAERRFLRAAVDGDDADSASAAWRLMRSSATCFPDASGAGYISISLAGRDLRAVPPAVGTFQT